MIFVLCVILFICTNTYANYLFFSELEFPSSLTATERAFIHRLCQGMGFHTKSCGSVDTFNHIQLIECFHLDFYMIL